MVFWYTMMMPWHSLWHACISLYLRCTFLHTLRRFLVYSLPPKHSISQSSLCFSARAWRVYTAGMHLTTRSLFPPACSSNIQISPFFVMQQWRGRLKNTVKNSRAFVFVFLCKSCEKKFGHPACRCRGRRWEEHKHSSQRRTTKLLWRGNTPVQKMGEWLWIWRWYPDKQCVHSDVHFCLSCLVFKRYRDFGFRIFVWKVVHVKFWF